MKRRYTKKNSFLRLYKAMTERERMCTFSPSVAVCLVLKNMTPKIKLERN